MTFRPIQPNLPTYQRKQLTRRPHDGPDAPAADDRGRQIGTLHMFVCEYSRQFCM